MAKIQTAITTLHLSLEERDRLQKMGRERMRSQSHLIRTALAFWWANGTPEVPADFDPVGRAENP